MAWQYFYGGTVSTSSGNSALRAVLSIQATDNGSTGYNVETWYCVEVTKGDFTGSKVNRSWGSQITVSGTGQYGAAYGSTVFVAYGSSQSFSCNCTYVSRGLTSTASGSFTAPRPTYTVAFNANGGSGAPGNQTKTYGTTLTLSSTKPTRDGYIFKGWGTSSTATTASYQPGGSYTANSGTTLYAIWEEEVTDLISFDVAPNNITIPCDTNGKISPQAITIPYTPIYTDKNYSTPFWYKICSVDDEIGNVDDIATNSDGLVYGGFSCDDIGDGAGDETTYEIPVSGAMLLRSLKACKNNTEVKFLVVITTGDNTFATKKTLSQIITCPIVDFNKLLISRISCMRTSPNNTQIKIGVQFPKSYELSVYPTPDLYIDGSGIKYEYTPNISSDSNNLATYIINLPITAINSSSHLLNFYITDNLFESILKMIVPAFGYDDPYISIQDKALHCIEIIEADFVAFEKGGVIYANEFIESDDGSIYFGESMEFNEIIEESGIHVAGVEAYKLPLVLGKKRGEF